MQPLTPAQVVRLNALANPEDSLETLWAVRHDGSRGQVVKVTANRVYFENTHDESLWSEPMSEFAAFKALRLTTELEETFSLKTHRLMKGRRELKVGSRTMDYHPYLVTIIDIDQYGHLHIEEVKGGNSYDMVDPRQIGAKWVKR